MHRSYDLKLGYSCNNHCIHCVIEDSKRTLLLKHVPIDISTNEAMSLIEKEVSNGLDSITITGGEATIRSDFELLLNYCFSKGLKITLQTNGRLLSKKNIQSVISKKPGLTLVVALHGTSSSIHDSITQVPGSFLETLEGIRLSISNRIPVILKTVISKKNMRDLPNFVPFMLPENIFDINMAFPHAQGAARINFDIVVPQYKTLRPYLYELAYNAKKEGVNLSFETIPFCILPEFPDLMSELAYACKDVKCTQVNEKTFDWNYVRRQIKTKMPCCASCFFNEYCEGPWNEYVEKYGTSEFLPVITE